MRVTVTVTAGGYGLAGEGMATGLIAVLRAAGFEGDPDHGTMTRVTDEEMTAAEIVSLFGST